MTDSLTLEEVRAFLTTMHALQGYCIPSLNHTNLYIPTNSCWVLQGKISNEVFQQLTRYEQTRIFSDKAIIDRLNYLAHPYPRQGA